jgi:hypothetical protein
LKTIHVTHEELAQLASLIENTIGDLTGCDVGERDTCKILAERGDDPRIRALASIYTKIL